MLNLLTDQPEFPCDTDQSKNKQLQKMQDYRNGA
jgi:hypothetical protein